MSVPRNDAPNTDPARELAIAAARMAEDANATDILVLDLREISPVTDYFVIGTGTSGRQMKSIVDDLKMHGREIGQKVWQVAGLDSATWIIVDFVDVVVHLFDAEHRDYYDLELIWGEAPRVDWQRAGHAAEANRRSDD